MKDETSQTVKVLHALKSTLPEIERQLIMGEIDQQRQAEFGVLLIEAGQLLQDHSRGAGADVVDGEML